MNVTRLASQDAQATAAAASVAATYAQTPTIGNLMVAVVFSNVTNGNNVITGWTVYGDSSFNTAGNSVTILFKVAAATDTTTVTATAAAATAMSLHVYEYSGMRTGQLTDINITGSAAANTSATGGTLRPQHRLDLLIAGFGFATATSSPSMGNGFTMHLSDANLISGDQVTTNYAASFNATAAWTTSSASGNVGAALKGQDMSPYYNRGLKPRPFSPGLAR